MEKPEFNDVYIMVGTDHQYYACLDDNEVYELKRRVTNKWSLEVDLGAGKKLLVPANTQVHITYQKTRGF